MELDHPSHVRLEFWFDFASTYSYLSAMRIDPLAERSRGRGSLDTVSSRPDLAKWGADFAI